MNVKHTVSGVAGAARAEPGASVRATTAPPPEPSPARAPGQSPAVNVQVSLASGGAVQAMVAAEMSDVDLLDALKARIASGEFEIDYQGLASALVEDAVLALGGHAAPREG